MASKKTVLVLDWSNLLYRSLFLNRLFKGAVTYNDPDEISSFIYKFTTDVCSLLKLFSPNKLFIAADAKHSWRKDVDPLNVSYKGNREKDNDINWDMIYSGSDDLLDIFKKHGANVAYINNAEADDMMAMIKEVAFEEFQEYNIIIVSADADIRQLIEFKGTDQQYCVVYNTISRGKGSKRYIFAPDNFIDWVNAPDPVASDIFFSNVDFNKKYIKDLINFNNAIELHSTNPHDVVLDKIFCGDDGDNIPAFYEWYKNGKKARVTPSKFKKLQDELKFTDVSTLCEKEVLLKPTLERILKKELDDIDVSERLLRQRKLVELHSTNFPDKIAAYKDVIKQMFLRHDGVTWGQSSTNNILANTKYLSNATKERKSIEKSLFKDFDALTAKNKTINNTSTIDLLDGLF